MRKPEPVQYAILALLLTALGIFIAAVATGGWDWSHFYEQPESQQTKRG